MSFSIANIFKCSTQNHFILVVTLFLFPPLFPFSLFYILKLFRIDNGNQTQTKTTPVEPGANQVRTVTKRILARRGNPSEPTLKEEEKAVEPEPKVSIILSFILLLLGPCIIIIYPFFSNSTTV